MRDYLEVETSPCSEECVSVLRGVDTLDAQRHEANVMREYLYRVFGEPPGMADIYIKRNEHDFGTYLSLKLVFDDEEESEVEWAYKIEGNTPDLWDDEARQAMNVPVIHDYRAQAAAWHKDRQAA